MHDVTAVHGGGSAILNDNGCATPASASQRIPPPQSVSRRHSRSPGDGTSPEQYAAAALVPEPAPEQPAAEAASTTIHPHFPIVMDCVPIVLRNAGARKGGGPQGPLAPRGMYVFAARAGGGMLRPALDVTRVSIRRSAVLLALACSGALPGCVSSSIEGDLTTVRELAHAEALPALPEDSVAAAPDADSRKLLSGPLDVETAVRVALRENRELRAELRELGVARAALAQAVAIANPVVGAELPADRDADLELQVEYRISSLLKGPRADAASAEL